MGEIFVLYSKYAFSVAAGLLLLLCCSVGCKENQVATVMASYKQRNASNVCKVRTCFCIYEIRTGKWPKSQKELTQFLTSGHGRVTRDLERIDISPETVEDIFVSERDGKPLKIKWGIRMHRDRIMPVAFEEEGIDGVRLVAADVLLEVDNEQEYKKLWNGEYTPKDLGEGDDE